MGTLIVIRHAKTEPAAATDYVRELTERGRADAAATGRWLAGEGLVPDVALVSAARRARQTWVRVAGAAGWAVRPSIERSLYTADEYDVLALLGTLGDAETVAVIGHNPTMHALANLLDEDAGARDRLATGFPTSTVAVLDVPVPWVSLGPGGADLRSLHTARG